MAGLVRTVDPAIEPVTVQEAFDHLRVTDIEEETVVASLITAARSHCEEWLGRALIDQTWALRLDAFPFGTTGIRLPRPSLSSVTSVAYVDSAGDAQTWSSSEYQVVSTAFPGYIKPAYGYCYPTTQCDTDDTVTITYVSGYGAAAADVPADIRHGILIFITQLYESRCGAGMNVSTPAVCASLWWPHRAVTI